jgi:hydrogenase maturation factor
LTAAQCVKLIARDIEHNAMMTPENARRIVANFTDAEKITVMHVCGVHQPRRTAARYASRTSPPTTG